MQTRRQLPSGNPAHALVVALALLWVAPGVVGQPDEASTETVERHVRVMYESPLLAERGDARITHAEFDARMQAIPEGDRPGVLADPERIGKLFEDMLATQAIAQDAIERGALDDPLVQAELYRTMAVRLADIQRTHVMETAELDDYTQRAREIYLANKQEYRDPPTVGFTHLLIQNRAGVDAEARVRELLERVQQGESLEALAKQYSDDPSVERNGGRFEATPMDRLESGFREGISGLAEGETGVVESGYGWHLVRVDSRTPARPQSFEEVADKLREQARERHLTRVWENYLREVHAPELEIAPGGVAAILERYGVKSEPATEPPEPSASP